MEYGQRISMLREERQLTQEQLAHQIGITRAALSHYENNRREPDYETLLGIAHFFGVNADFLLGEGLQETGETKMPHTASSPSVNFLGYHVVHFRQSSFPGRLL